jgi:2-dehydropantoate 2-reductase
MSLKIAIVGTGAVGGWYGALLAADGHEVRCLARRDAAILNEKGIRLIQRGSDTVQRIALATANPEAIGIVDLVVVAAKTTANANLAQWLKPMCGPQTVLLTLQNGMGNAEVLTQIVEPARVVAGLCFVCINRTAPGVIENMLPGYIRMAAAQGPIHPNVRKCVDIFSHAGVDCKAEDSLDAVLWKKLCWNIPFNGLAITAGGVTTDRILSDPALRARARVLMHEVQSAAAACGVPFSEEHLERQFTVTETMEAYRPSSLIDYLEGKEVEIDPIWAIPLARGIAAGVPMPELSKLLSEIQELVAKRKG